MQQMQEMKWNNKTDFLNQIGSLNKPIPLKNIKFSQHPEAKKIKKEGESKLKKSLNQSHNQSN